MQSAGIIGYGAQTAVGHDAPATAAAVRAGLINIEEHPFMIDRAGEPMFVAMVPELEEANDPSDRFTALAAPAIAEALAPFDLAKALDGDDGLSVALALPEARPGLTKDALHSIGERVVDQVSQIAPVSDAHFTAAGHAGSIAAFGHALAVLEKGAASLVLVGGIESYIFADTLEWLDDLDQLHSERTTWGFAPGEAAAFCLLAAPEVLQQIGASVAVGVIAEGSAQEPNRNLTESVCVGKGMSTAWKAALMKPGFSEAYIAHTLCDLNGDPYRGNEYGFAMLRNREHFVEGADFQTPAESWGDVGAASGPLFAILTAVAQSRGYAPGPYSFAFAGSNGGARAAMVLAAHEEAN